MASLSSLSLPLPLPGYAPHTARLRLGTPHLPSPAARLQPTKGLKAVVAAAASYKDGAAPALVDVDNNGSGRLLQAADVAAMTRIGSGAAHAGQPKEGGGGGVNAVLTTAVLGRAPARPGLPAEGTGGQGGKVH